MTFSSDTLLTLLLLVLLVLIVAWLIRWTERRDMKSRTGRGSDADGVGSGPAFCDLPKVSCPRTY